MASFLNQLSVLSASSATQQTNAVAAGNLPTTPALPWRAAEWARPALTMITVPNVSAGTQSQVGDLFGTLANAPAFVGQPTYLVFDAVLRASHVRELRRTEHPIQASGSAPVTSITDHAFRLPAKITLDIGMSDAMQSYFATNWTSNASKSVSAFQTLRDLQARRAILTLATRLDTYQNVIIESISPTESEKTRFGLRASVVFSEVFFATVTSVHSSVSFASTDDTTNPLSANAQKTAATPLGVVQPGNPTASMQAQNNIDSPLCPLPGDGITPGAGTWSSTNVAGLGSL